MEEVDLREYALCLYHDFHDHHDRTHATHDFLMPESIVPMLDRARRFVGFLDEGMLASFRAIALEHAERLLTQPRVSFNAAHEAWLAGHNYSSSLCVDNYVGMAGDNTRVEFVRRIAPIPGQMEMARSTSERDRDASDSFRTEAVDRAALLRHHERSQDEQFRRSTEKHAAAQAAYCASAEDAHISAGEMGRVLNMDHVRDGYLSRRNYSHQHY